MVIPSILRKRLDELATAGVFQDFYLAGGTGLALMIEHRRSVDIDLFSQTNRLDFDGRRTLLTRLRRVPRWTILETKDGTLHGRLGRVRVSFFWYPQPLVKPLLHHEPIRVASLEDIGLMKIGAIIGRGARKDFVDVYAICQRIPLRRLLRHSRKKFVDSHDFLLQALKALVFFEDAERDPSIVMHPPLAWSTVKQFFVNDVQTIARQHLKSSKRA